MKTYTTVQGDMWDHIAHDKLGGVRHTRALLRANRQYLGYYIFPAGIVLTLPEVEEEAAASSLPPWKQGSK